MGFVLFSVVWISPIVIPYQACDLRCFAVSRFFGVGSWSNRGSVFRVTNRATRPINWPGTPLRGARALNVTRCFFVFLRASIFVCGAKKASVKICIFWFGKRYISGFTKHAGASLFWHYLSPDFWCRPLASNFAGGFSLSGQSANMRRPIATSTESVFKELGQRSVTKLYA